MKGGRYNMFWLVARQPNIILLEYTNACPMTPPDRIYISVHLLNFISRGMRQVAKGISTLKWLLGSHFVLLQF